MQNFTFGRKGTNWFLFAFLLLIGNLSSFGQTGCVSVADTAPSNLCYLESTIADLEAASGASTTIGDIVFFNEADSTNPLSPSEFLVDGEDYFVGSSDSSCSDREEITVNFGDTTPAPTSNYGNIYSPCLSSESEDRPVSDLLQGFVENSADLIAFTSRTGADTAAPSENLEAGGTYYIGQSTSGTCNFSYRTPVRYSPDPAVAPIADSTQEFCEGATIADLEASGTSENTQAIFWYSADNSITRLDSSEELVNGATYYASQIINNEGIPEEPCESQDRAAVTVEIIEFDAGADVSTQLCLAEVEQRLADGEAPQSLFLTLVEDRNLPSDVSFNPSIPSIAGDFNEDPTQTFTTEATFTTEEGCEDSVVLSITVEESFEAGDDNTGNTLCRSQIGGTASATQVENYLLGLLSDDADQDGEFSPSPSEIADDLNDTSDEITFDITYTVGEGTSCEDSAILEVTVFEGADYQIVQPEPLCNDDIPALVNEIPEDVEALFLENFDGATPNGEFEEGTIQAVIDQYNQNNIGTFNATFIAQTEDGCSEPIELERTVIEGEPANAGNFDNIEDVCTNEEPIDLTSLSNTDPNAISGGTFSGTGVENNEFDPSVGAGEYTITYTVDESLDCIEGSEDTTFTIEVIQGPNAGQDISGSRCISELAAIVLPNIGDNEAIIQALFGEFGFDGEPEGSIESNLGNDFDEIGNALLAYYLSEDRDSSITIEGTYTVGDPQDVCGTDESTFAITIIDGELLDAGEDNTDNTLCNADIPGLVDSVPDDVEDLYFDLLEDGVPRNGTFNPSISQIISAYNSNNFQTFSTTYTIGTEECSDSVELAITVIEPGEAVAEANDDEINVCTSETSYNLNDALTEDSTEGGTFFLEGEEFEGNIFDASTREEGPYNFSYTISEEDASCIEGEATASFTINVTSDFDFGDDITDILCESEVPANLTADIIEDYYLGLVSDLPSGGSFSTSPEEILAQYNNNPFDTFTTIYSVESGDCEGSVSVSVTVQEEGDANAGDIDDQVACTTAGMIDLEQYLVGSGAQMGGTFSGVGVEDNMFDASMEADEYEITYTVTDAAPCVTEGTEDSDIFIISIIEPGQAIAEAADAEIDVCTSETSYNLNNALSEDSTLGGTFFLDGEEFDGNTFDATEVDAGEYSFTYTVSSEDLDCIEGSATTDFTINVTSDFDFGNDITDILCESEVPANLTADIIEDYYLGLVSELPSGGTFSTTPEEILAQYNDNPYDTFTTIYTVNSGDCEGSVSVSVTVQEEGDANAGDIDDQVACTTDGMIALEQYLVGSGAQMGGTFSGEGVEDGMFDASMEVGEYEITYSVDDSAPCVTEGTEDSDIFIISIIEPGQAIAEAADAEIDVCTSETSYNLNGALSEDTTLGGTFSLEGEEFDGNIFDATSVETGEYSFTYTVNSEVSECIEGEATASFVINVTSQTFDAGEDTTFTVCSVGLDPTPTLVEVRNYYLNLLADGVPTNGTFSPSMEEIRQAYLADQIGTFTTTYTIGNGACEDSVELTVVVTDVIPAEVGEIADQTVCSSDEDLNLYDLITSGNEDGTFEGYENGIFSPSMMDAGTYEITYTVNEDTPCVEGEASTTFTIEVLQGANAGEDMDVSVCTNDDLQDLFSLISVDADMDGDFTLDGEVITDGIMDPSAFEAGTYEVVYTVMAEDDQCGGDDTATITITLGEAPEAPTTGEAVAFCAIDGATAALLNAEGTNLTWYSDADLSMMVSEEDLLVNGEYYVTQTAENGCESEAAMIMVNIVDSPAPTISSDYELCAFDNPTLADLTAEINETGEVTWYESADSMTALSNNAMLTDGTTYYATLISDNGCESSERLAVTVTLEDCALLFPEAITPNGDGRNDRLVIENIESEYPNYNITIFNRWGNAVYKGNASTPTWDGTSNQSGSLGDDVLPVGVYFYVVDFNDGSTEPRQGKVYLNR